MGGVMSAAKRARVEGAEAAPEASFDTCFERPVRLDSYGRVVDLGEVELDENASLDDPATAVFSDGTRMAISNLSVRDWECILEVRCGQVPHFHTTLGEDSLDVMDRYDRVLFVNLYQNSTQILQTRANAMPAKRKVVQLMIDLCKEYESGRVEKVDLKTKRDEMLRQRLADITAHG